MVHSFIFSEGKLAGRDLEVEALRLVAADKGLIVWVDLDNPTDDEIKAVLEGLFHFHPLAIEDCVTPSPLPKIEDYEEYLFMVTHAVDYSRKDKFATTELDLFLGKEFLVTFHRAPLRSVNALIEGLAKNAEPGPRGPDRLAHSLLDLLVDNYNPMLAELHTELEEIEEAVLSKASDEKFVSECYMSAATSPSSARSSARSATSSSGWPAATASSSAPSCCPTSATCATISCVSRQP